MNYGDSLVGGVAIMFAILAGLIAIGPWHQPYHLRTIALIQRRFGMPAARLFWLGLSVTCLASGVSILAGIRPSYALPASEARAAFAPTR